MFSPFRKPEVRLLEKYRCGRHFFGEVRERISASMCDLRSALARSYPFALLAGCPVNTFLVRGWMPYMCEICLQRFYGG